MSVPSNECARCSQVETDPLENFAEIVGVSRNTPQSSGHEFIPVARLQVAKVALLIVGHALDSETEYEQRPAEPVFPIQCRLLSFRDHDQTRRGGRQNPDTLTNAPTVIGTVRQCLVGNEERFTFLLPTLVTCPLENCSYAINANRPITEAPKICINKLR